MKRDLDKIYTKLKSILSLEDVSSKAPYPIIQHPMPHQPIPYAASANTLYPIALHPMAHRVDHHGDPPNPPYPSGHHPIAFCPSRPELFAISSALT